MVVNFYGRAKPLCETVLMLLQFLVYGWYVSIYLKKICFKLLLFCGRYKLHEVIAMLEEDDNFVGADVYITPPRQGEVTDENSEPEDDGGTVDNLARDQLQSTAEAVIQDRDDMRHVGGQDAESESSDVDDSGQPNSYCDRSVVSMLCLVSAPLYFRMLWRNKNCIIIIIIIPPRNVVRLLSLLFV